MSARQTIRITIEVEIDGVAAAALAPVDGWAGATGDDSQAPIPGALALGQWLAGAMAGDALTQIAPALDPAIGYVRVELENPYQVDGDL